MLSRPVLAAVITTCCLLSHANSQDANDAMNEHLTAFKPLLGKTWKGNFADATPEKPMFDVVQWERVLNGQGVRSRHSVNDGTYGGETMIMWDAKQKKLTYWYFTTAGFYTQGVMEVTDNKWTSTEDVVGEANGISKVKSVMELLDSGELHIKSEYFSNGKWIPGHEVKYKQDASAKVIRK